MTTFVQDLPKTLTGRDEGNFDQEKLRKAYDRAVAYAGNRQIYRMNIYKDYVKLTIANPARENAYDDITMRGAVVDSRPDGKSASIKPEETFRVSDTNFATLEHALGDAPMHGDKKSAFLCRVPQSIGNLDDQDQCASGMTIDEKKSTQVPFRSGKTIVLSAGTRRQASRQGDHHWEDPPSKTSAAPQIPIALPTKRIAACAVCGIPWKNNSSNRIAANGHNRIAASRFSESVAYIRLPYRRNERATSL